LDGPHASKRKMDRAVRFSGSSRAFLVRTSLRKRTSQRRALGRAHDQTHAAQNTALASSRLSATHAAERSYFVNIGFGGAAVGGAGDIAKVSHTFQPSGRWALSNSP